MTGTEITTSSRGGGLLAAALMAGLLAALTAVLALAAPQRSFLHLATNLSNAPERWSGFADIGVSPDGDRVAVVWPEEYQGAGAPRGSVMLRWASESTGSGWSSPMLVFPGDGDLCAAQAAVAVTGTTAHVAYITWDPCLSPEAQAIRYEWCSLQPGGSCDNQVTVLTSTLLGAGDPGFGWVDIALDVQGNPHFVYDYFRSEGSEDVGTVYYTWLEDGTSRPEERVSGSDRSGNGPAIAWSNGHVHVVWAEEPYGGSGNYEIHYRRRTSGSGWEADNVLSQQGDTYPPRNPAVAAYSDTVFVVWDMGDDCQEVGGEKVCTRFSLAYNYSLDGGANWLSEWHEVGTDGEMTQDMIFSSTDADDMWEYTRCLQPTVALDGEGRPTVVWHVNQGSEDWPDYDVKYNEGLTVTQFGAVWSSKNGEFLSQRTGGQSGSPVVALAPVTSPHLHVAYLWSDMDEVGQPYGDWETYYDSNEYGSYPKVYLPLLFRNFVGGET